MVNRSATLLPLQNEIYRFTRRAKILWLMGRKLIERWRPLVYTIQHAIQLAKFHFLRLQISTPKELVSISTKTSEKFNYLKTLLFRELRAIPQTDLPGDFQVRLSRIRRIWKANRSLLDWYSILEWSFYQFPAEKFSDHLSRYKAFLWAVNDKKHIKVSPN